MPLYEYQCDACGSRFEVIQKYSDPPVDACTSCGGSVKKLLSSPAIQFKGSGWYITDYARKGSTGAASKSSSSDSTPSSSGESKPSEGASTTPASTPAKTDT